MIAEHVESIGRILDRTFADNRIPVELVVIGSNEPVNRDTRDDDYSARDLELIWSFWDNGAALAVYRTYHVM